MEIIKEIVSSCFARIRNFISTIRFDFPSCIYILFLFAAHQLHKNMKLWKNMNTNRNRVTE